MGKGYGTNHVQNGYAVYDDGSKESITSLQLIIGGTTTAVFMAQSKIIYSVIKR
jgi:hypothetical protein